MTGLASWEMLGSSKVFNISLKCFILGNAYETSGYGDRVQKAVRKQINLGLAQLEERLAGNESTVQKVEPVTRQKMEDIPPQIGQPPDHDPPNVARYPPHINGGSAPGYGRANEYHSGQITQAAGGGPAPGQYAYPQQQQRPEFNNIASTAYPLQGTSRTHDQGLAAVAPNYNQVVHQGINGAMDGVYVSNSNTYSSADVYGADNNSWYQYPQPMPSGVGHQDYQPASALLQLGRQPEHATNGNLHGMQDGYDASAVNAGTLEWPTLILDPPPGGLP